MNILILVEAFMPSKISAAVMMYDLAIEYKNRGHNVWVVTFINEEEINSKDRVIFEDLDGINVIRIVSPNKKNISLIKRGIVEITSAYELDKLTKKYLDKVSLDLIVEYSPNIMLSVFMKQLKKKHNCKSYLVLRDIFPAWARDLGVINNKLVYNYFRHVEKQMYKNSDIIGVQSPKNREYLLENNNLDERKVDVLYNWVQEPKKLDKEDYIDYRKLYGIENKVVFLYGGNIGTAQELEFLLQLANEVKHNEEAVFLIVGDGVEKSKLVEKYKYLSNVIFKDSIEPSKYEMLVRQCDVGLVNLNRDFKTHNIPGKLLTYWNYGKPVLAAINKGNDLFEIINENNAGACVETGDLESYINGFNYIMKNKKVINNIGKNGKKFAGNNFNVKISANKIIESFK